MPPWQGRSLRERGRMGREILTVIMLAMLASSSVQARQSGDGTGIKGKEMPTATDRANTGSAPNKPQYGWVQVEYRDAEGNPTLPRELIESTYRRRYEEVAIGTKISVHVLAGYKPKPLMMVEQKLYEIHRLSVRGWRRSGQISAEVEAWRHYEADWFNAMRGAALRISDPGLPGPHNEEVDYAVSETSFARKIVTSVNESGGKTEIQLHEGTLHISETWKSTWRRQRAAILNLGFKLLLIPLLVALGAGLALLWVSRSPTLGGNEPPSQETAAEHGTQRSTGSHGNKDESTKMQFP